jgi:hypothetical protein
MVVPPSPYEIVLGAGHGRRWGEWRRRWDRLASGLDFQYAVQEFRRVAEDVHIHWQQNLQVRSLWIAGVDDDVARSDRDLGLALQQVRSRNSENQPVRLDPDLGGQ